MAIDRDATLKQAEKLLRQGKLDGAIEEYVRLLDEQPEDWNSINALGDLYLRASKNDLAGEQFTRVADHQFAEGFFPKAAALYKKALKVKPDDEHIFMQLAEIGERQGKFADAKFYLLRVARQREARGEQRAAAECILRLGSLEGSDLESKLAAAKAAQDIGDAFRAVELLKDAANVHDKEKRRNEALQLLADAAEIDPFDAELRNRLAREFVSAGLPNRARAYLSADTAGDDPDLLMALATIEFADGKEDDARTAMGRVLALAPEREADVVRLAEELIGTRAGGGRVFVYRRHHRRGAPQRRCRNVPPASAQKFIRADAAHPRLDQARGDLDRRRHAGGDAPGAAPADRRLPRGAAGRRSACDRRRSRPRRTRKRRACRSPSARPRDGRRRSRGGDDCAGPQRPARVATQVTICSRWTIWI